MYGFFRIRALRAFTAAAMIADFWPSCVLTIEDVRESWLELVMEPDEVTHRPSKKSM
jgi:hypothetical protein